MSNDGSDRLAADDRDDATSTHRDLLGIGLAVYFVALIGIVAVMLVLAAVVPRA